MHEIIEALGAPFVETRVTDYRHGALAWMELCDANNFRQLEYPTPHELVLNNTATSTLVTTDFTYWEYWNPNSVTPVRCHYSQYHDRSGVSVPLEPINAGYQLQTVNGVSQFRFANGTTRAFSLGVDDMPDQCRYTGRHRHIERMIEQERAAA